MRAIFRGTARMSGLLVSVFISLSGCAEDDVCEVSGAASGALETLIDWPSAECNVDSDFGGVGHVSAREAGAELTFDIADRNFSVGTHVAEVTFSFQQQLWTNEANCSVQLVVSEVVPWTQSDYRRLQGTVTCGGPLDDVFGDNDLTLTATSFSVYTEDSSTLF